MGVNCSHATFSDASHDDQQIQQGQAAKIERAKEGYGETLMAEKKKKRSSAEYYANNPEAYKKKLEYDRKRNARPDRKKYRAELARERRARGLMGNGGPDVSHTADGKFRLENPSKNRARNGHGNNGRLAPGRGSRKSSKRK